MSETEKQTLPHKNYKVGDYVSLLGFRLRAVVCGQIEYATETTFTVEGIVYRKYRGKGDYYRQGCDLWSVRLATEQEIAAAKVKRKAVLEAQQKKKRAHADNTTILCAFDWASLTYETQTEVLRLIRK